jgi:hypothetical protein
VREFAYEKRKTSMMTQLRRKTTAIVAALAVNALVLVPAPTQAAAPALSLPVVGTVVGGGSFSGVLSLTSFAVQNGQAVALGTLSGILTTAAGVVTTVVSNVAIPLQVGTATCDVLHLDIGPISLNLLGLQVNLSQIVLDVTAQAGPGNLLGNLLCAVAGLLDNPAALVKVLNQILAALIG